MNIYLLSQSVNTGYDTYDSCIVTAIDEEDARTIHPSQYNTHFRDGNWYGTYEKGGEYLQNNDSSWVDSKSLNEIEVTLLGKADESLKRGVICASFNAG